MMMQRTANRSHASLIVIRGVVLAVLIIAGTGCSSPSPQITIEGQYAELSPLLSAPALFI